MDPEDDSAVILQKLEDQLTCGICLQEYNQARALPCLHSFCLTCIDRLSPEIKGGKYFIHCPTCRKPAELPEKGAIDLPNDFHINQLYDIQQFVQNSPTLTRKPTLHETTVMHCQLHDKTLRFFCITCQKLICRNCTTLPSHGNHGFYLVKDVYPLQKAEIEGKLEKLLEKLDEVSSAMTALTDTEREIEKQGEDVKKKIHNHAQHIVELVQQSEKQLTEQVDTIVKRKTWLLDKQREEMKSGFDQLKSCEEFVQHSLKKNTPEKLLDEKQSLIKNIETLIESTNHVVLVAVEEADITFKEKHASAIVQQVGSLTCKYFQEKCKAFVKTLITPVSKRKSSITLGIKTKDERPFSIPASHLFCELVSIGNSQPFPYNIMKTEPGIYDIAFTPTNYGEYLLKVMIGGMEICDSPFVIHVAINPELQSRSVKVITGLNKPRSIAITKSGRVVVAMSECVKMYNCNCQEIVSFPIKGILHGKSANPRGVAITSNQCILVTDDHRVQKLNLSNGHCIKSVGTHTHMFYTPSGIAVHINTGKVFIADTGNHKIQVLNCDLTFSHNFGGYGSLPHQFQGPCDVALDNEGIVYVADTSNHCIKKFTPEGQYLTQFGSQGSDHGELLRPTGISVSSDGFVYIAEEENKRISIFNSNGEFISCFGPRINDNEEFREPQFITVDTLGNVYVSDMDKVYLFLKMTIIAIT